MIAYLILVHRYPDQFKRLFKAIYHHSNHYLIHVDKRSGPELQQEIADFLADYPNAAMLPSKNALWGGYSLVSAELRGIAALLELDAPAAPALGQGAQGLLLGEPGIQRFPLLGGALVLALQGGVFLGLDEAQMAFGQAKAGLIGQST